MSTSSSLWWNKFQQPLQRQPPVPSRLSRQRLPRTQWELRPRLRAILDLQWSRLTVLPSCWSMTHHTTALLLQIYANVRSVPCLASQSSSTHAFLNVPSNRTAWLHPWTKALLYVFLWLISMHEAEEMLMATLLPLSSSGQRCRQALHLRALLH